MKDKPLAYAAYSRDEEIRLSSSSGGVFFHLAEHIIDSGGIVYGVAMSSDKRTAHFVCITEKKQLPEIMRSKYLQASVGDTFREIEDQLKKGLLVLFSGTGCQINGLKSFLRKEYNKLLCTDIICHGVPSSKLWGSYVDYVEKKYHGVLTDVNFRCKDDCWADFGIKESIGSEKTYFTSKEVDPYMLMFLRDCALRPSCYECVAKVNKSADITLADFWGIHLIYPDMDDGKGTSFVILRTEKGVKLFNDVKDNMVYRNVDFQDGIRGNKAEFQSTKRPDERNEFYLDFNKMEFEGLIRKYGKPNRIPLIKRVKRIIKSILKMLKKCGGRIRAAYEYGLSLRIKEEEQIER